MSKALDDILGKNQAPALAQQQPAAPVSQTPKPQVDNSNAGNATNVQAEAAGKAADAAAQQPKSQNTQNATRNVGAALPKLPGITAKAETGSGSTLPQNTPESLSYTEMFKRLNPYKQPTEEELETERKKQKRTAVFSALGDGLSALANVYFASQGSPNMSSGEGATKKVNDRWEKLKQERRENAEKYAAGLMNAARLDEARKEAARRAETEEQRWQQTFNFQKAANEAGQNLAREKFNWEKENKQQAFDEGVRQFNETSEQNKTKINAEAKRQAREAKKGEITFALGEGKGTVNISTDANNAANVAYVFSKLPAEIRDNIHGDAIYDKITGQKVIGYKSPTQEAMLIAIGTYVQDYPEVQTALKEIAGIKPEGVKPNPMRKKD